MLCGKVLQQTFVKYGITVLAHKLNLDLQHISQLAVENDVVFYHDLNILAVSRFKCKILGLTVTVFDIFHIESRVVTRVDSNKVQIGSNYGRLRGLRRVRRCDGLVAGNKGIVGYLELFLGSDKRPQQITDKFCFAKIFCQSISGDRDFVIYCGFVICVFGKQVFRIESFQQTLVESGISVFSYDLHLDLQYVVQAAVNRDSVFDGYLNILAVSYLKSKILCLSVAVFDVFHIKSRVVTLVLRDEIQLGDNYGRLWRIGRGDGLVVGNKAVVGYLELFCRSDKRPCKITHKLCFAVCFRQAICEDGNFVIYCCFIAIIFGKCVL